MSTRPQKPSRGKAHGLSSPRRKLAQGTLFRLRASMFVTFVDANIVVFGVVVVLSAVCIVVDGNCGGGVVDRVAFCPKIIMVSSEGNTRLHNHKKKRVVPL